MQSSSLSMINTLITSVLNRIFLALLNNSQFRTSVISAFILYWKLLSLRTANPRLSLHLCTLPGLIFSWVFTPPQGFTFFVWSVVKPAARNSLHDAKIRFLKRHFKEIPLGNPPEIGKRFRGKQITFLGLWSRLFVKLCFFTCLQIWKGVRITSLSWQEQNRTLDFQLENEISNSGVLQQNRLSPSCRTKVDTRFLVLRQWTLANTTGKGAHKSTTEGICSWDALRFRFKSILKLSNCIAIWIH